MSRTIRCRKGKYVWWKKQVFCHYDSKEGREKVFYSHDIIAHKQNTTLAFYSGKKPHGADGTWSETTPRTGLKKRTSYYRRSNERVFLNKIIKDEDIDNVPYPCEKETKYLMWVFF